ncbi:MAG: response regulator [Myxococcales bacterium]
MDQVLLLEDEIVLRGTLSRHLLTHQAISVVEARGIQEAIDALDATMPRLVVAGLSLPDGSGLDLLPELASRGLKIPVIFVAGEVGIRPELPENSNIDVIQKPVDGAAFRELVKRRLERVRTLPPPASVFTVADYLQLAALTRRSVGLSVSNGLGSHGRIVIEAGDVTWANDELGEGVEAFSRLALLEDADIHCESLTGVALPANLTGSLEQLLLDAVRIADERASRSMGRFAKAPNMAAISGDPSGIVQLDLRSREAAPTTTALAAGLPPLRGQKAPASPTPAPRASPESRSNTVRTSNLTPFSGGASSARAGASATPQVPQATNPTSSKEPARAPNAPQEKEKTVNASNTAKNEVALGEVLQRAPTLRAAARAERDGSVVANEGEMDAETGCAVAALAARQLGEAAAELGLGEPESWCISMGSSNWYVVNEDFGFLLVMGGANKNPMAVLKKIASGQGR